jgi:hypothetical protein
MNNETKKYEELVKQIKATPPVMADPEKLTARILQRIENTPQKKNRNKTLAGVSWVTSIAASLLIGLFLFEQLTTSTNREHQNAKISDRYFSLVLDKNRNIEKQNTLTNFNDWLRIKKERQKKQQAFYSSIINKHKI